MNAALKRRVAPSTPLKLELEEDEGKLVVNLRLSFDFNAIALIEEKTGLFVIGGGEKSVWNQLHSARVLSVMLWAACLAHSPEYDTEDGLAIIRSYMSAGNTSEIAKALDEAFLLSLPADRQEKIRAIREREAADPKAPEMEMPEAGLRSGPRPVTI